MPRTGKLYFLAGVLFFSLACNLAGGGLATPTLAVPLSPTPDLASEPVTSTVTPAQPADLASTPEPAQPEAIVHLVFPANLSDLETPNYDVESNGTAPEKRAPYGDSYNLNLLERPFGPEMSYLPEVDIRAFHLVSDQLWHYVTIELLGSNFNSDLGIHFGVVLDTDLDGYGNFLVWAAPPYGVAWSAMNVKVFADGNHDTAGRSPLKSDAPGTGNGYETLLYDGGAGFGDDLDLAWVRLTGERLVQLAFKKNLAGDKFLFGVLADAGLKDVSRMDYVDALTELQAGSPVRGNSNYPLKELFAVDSTCHQAYGFVPTGYEPKICPLIVQATEPATSNSKPGGDSGGGGDPNVCQPPPGGCPMDAPNWWPDPHCACSTQPYNP